MASRRSSDQLVTLQTSAATRQRSRRISCARSASRRIVPLPSSFLDYCVAHEIAHKLGLKHPTKDIPLGAKPDPLAYTDSKYWRNAGEALNTAWFYAVVEEMSSGFGQPIKLRIIQRVLPGETGQARNLGDLGLDFHTIHGKQHKVLAMRSEFAVNLPDPALLLRHTGDLMDWTHEHGDMAVTFKAESRQTIKVKE